MCDFYLVNDLCSRLDNICCFTTPRIECTDNCFDTPSANPVLASVLQAFFLNHHGFIQLLKYAETKEQFSPQFLLLTRALEALLEKSIRITGNCAAPFAAFPASRTFPHRGPEFGIWTEWESAKRCFLDSALLAMHECSREIPDKPGRGCSAGLAGPRAAPLRGRRPARRALTMNGFAPAGRTIATPRCETRRQQLKMFTFQTGRRRCWDRKLGSQTREQKNFSTS